MSRLLAGELIKLRTTRTAIGFGVAGLLLALAASLISILAGDLATVQDKKNALNFGGGIGILFLLFGAVGATGEFRHRTLAPAVLIAPDRLRLVLARIAAYKLAGLVFGLLIAAIVLGIGAALLGGEPGPGLSGSDYARLGAGSLLDVVLCAAIGVGVGTLVRNQVAAVIGILIWLTILEPLTGLLGDHVVDYTLGSTLDRVGRGGAASGDVPGWGASMLLLVAWAVVLCVAGAVIDRRRDVD
jgi:ABC-2 type transport system permease protein